MIYIHTTHIVWFSIQPGELKQSVNTIQGVPQHWDKKDYKFIKVFVIYFSAILGLDWNSKSY